MKSKTLGLFAIGLLAAPTLAMADIVLQYGGSAGIGIRDCGLAPGCSSEAASRHSISSTSMRLTRRAFTSTPPCLPWHLTRAWQRVRVASRLSVRGSNAGPFGNPTIRATAYSANSRVTSGGWLMQSYTWDGSGPASRTVSGNLTYSVSGGFPGVGGGAIFIGMSIFTTGANTATLLESPGCGVGGLTFDLGATCIENADLLASSVLTLIDSTLDGAFDLSLPSITLDSAGETIFVLLSLVGFAELGGYTDASHTFVASFDDETGLKPAVTVAEPAALALLCIGLAGLGFSRRKQ